MSLDNDQVSVLDNLPNYMPELGKPRGVANPNLGTLLKALEDGDAQIGVVAATPGNEDTNAIDVVCQLKDLAGVAIAEARQVMIRSIAVSADKGDLAAATAAVGTVKEAYNPATGENVLWMETTAGGAFSFKVTNDVAEETVVSIQADGCLPKVLKLTFA